MSISPLQGGKVISVKAAVVPRPTGDIPVQEMEPADDLLHLQGLSLADPTFHLPGRVDILLGSDIYPQLMEKTPIVTGAISEPAAQKTIFGWAIIGPVRAKVSSIQSIPTNSVQVLSSDEDLDSLLSNFWTSEEPDPPPQSDGAASSIFVL